MKIRIRIPDRVSLAAMVVLIAIGIGALSYPTVANIWNSFNQTHMIEQYGTAVEEEDTSRTDAMIEEARKYNRRLAETQQVRYFSPSEFSRYEKKLDITGTGILGYVDIPCIDCVYPVYHGTGNAVLQIALGHVEWTSLPVGGESTHSVISGHCGLMSSELFTRLNEVPEGEIFQIHVGEETYSYKIDQIKVVEPEDMEDLLIVEGKDYCTLLTCTPYGVNSHRLLVRGERTSEEPGKRELMHIGFNEAVFIAAMMIGAMICSFAAGGRRRRAGAGDDRR